MKLIPIKCPQCHSNINIPDDDEFSRCEFCGTNIFFGKIHEGKLSAKNFLKLADSALLAGNYTEGNYYYTKVLEENSDVAEAWEGKAVCQLELAETDRDKAKQAFISFRNAIKLVNKDAQNTMEWKAANLLIEKAEKEYQNSRSIFKDIDWVIFLYQNSLEFVPYNLDAMKRIVNICYDSTRSDLEDIIYFYEQKLKEHDETYVSVYDRQFYPNSVIDKFKDEDESLKFQRNTINSYFFWIGIVFIIIIVYFLATN